jgi:Ca2+-binding EF-hand superfamily protein
MRFQRLDTNRDGVITRSEWRGNGTSFRNQDWNQDGILSGEEVRTGGRRQENWNQDWNRDGKVDSVDTQISQRFRAYDMNDDNRVARTEWAGDARLFTRLDTSRDGHLSMEEYAQGGGFTLDAEAGPSSRFSKIDRNNDGWVTRNEWNLNPASFKRLDLNRDDRISRAEFDKVANMSSPSSDHDRFAAVDVNHDGWLVRSEWRDTEDAFTRVDANRDNRLSRTEYDAEITTEPTRGSAWRSGFDRGTQEGRAAGREDHTRRQGWDLEGQRELERADSGYTFQVGTLSDYRTGYREAFRIAYRAGFTEAGGRAPR